MILRYLKFEIKLIVSNENLKGWSGKSKNKMIKPRVTETNPRNGWNDQLLPFYFSYSTSIKHLD